MKFMSVSIIAAMASVGVCLTTGCDREISRETTVETNSDGTGKAREERVVEKPDGTISKTEKEVHTDR